MKKKFGTFAIFFSLSMIFLFIDFYTKAYAYYVMPYNVDVFQNVLGVDFSLTLAMNKGAAWGLFAEFQYLILALRIAVIVSLLFYLFFSNREKKLQLPLVLIVTGALGNILDFFLYGFVVDFFRFNLWGYPFPVFNVADILITSGVILFFLTSLLTKKKRAVC